MRLFVPVWIIATAAFLAHASGAIDTTSKILSGIDKSANAIIDLRGVVP